MLSYPVARKSIQAGLFTPAYLLYGNEAFLRRELINHLTSAFLGSQSSSGLDKVDGSEVTLDEALSRLSGANLFASRQLLVVNNPPYLAPPPGKKEKDSGAAKDRAAAGREELSLEQLTRFLEQEGARGAPAKIIVFQAPAVDRRRRLFKLLDEKGTAVECAPLKHGELARWIQGRVAQAGKKIERAAVERLLLTGENDLNRLSHELDKYIAYLAEGEDTITAGVVDLLFAGDAQGNIFKLADALGEGNLSRALQMLGLLLRRREEPLYIFFMLVRHFRILLGSRSLRDQKIPVSRHAAVLRVKPFVAARLNEQAAYYPRESLEEIMMLLQQTDRQIKTGRIEPRLALEIVISRIHQMRGKR